MTPIKVKVKRIINYPTAENKKKFNEVSWNGRVL